MVTTNNNLQLPNTWATNNTTNLPTTPNTNDCKGTTTTTRRLQLTILLGKPINQVFKTTLPSKPFPFPFPSSTPQPYNLIKSAPAGTIDQYEHEK
jgi:hypothetical protein